MRKRKEYNGEYDDNDGYADVGGRWEGGWNGGDNDDDEEPKDKSQVQLVMVGHRWAMVGQYNIGGLCSIVCWAQTTISKTARTLTDPIQGPLTS